MRIFKHRARRRSDIVSLSVEDLRRQLALTEKLENRWWETYLTGGATGYIASFADNLGSLPIVLAVILSVAGFVALFSWGSRVHHNGTLRFAAELDELCQELYGKEDS